MTEGSPFPLGTDGWLGRRWLTTAIHAANPAAVAWVLSKGPQVNYVDEEGFTALMSALQVEKDCQLPLAEAASLTIQLIDLLLGAGTNVNLRAEPFDTSALHIAAQRSSATVLRHLLDKGAAPCAVEHDYVPKSPAQMAKDLKRWEVSTILCEAMARQGCKEEDAS